MTEDEIRQILLTTFEDKRTLEEVFEAGYKPSEVLKTSLTSGINLLHNKKEGRKRILARLYELHEEGMSITIGRLRSVKVTVNDGAKSDSVSKVINNNGSYKSVAAFYKAYEDEINKLNSELKK